MSLQTLSLKIHEEVKDKLKYFLCAGKIPNIIFHGSSGSGKRTIVNEFIDLIYKSDKRKINDLVMYVNCAHGKGIKFIREEVKFFAKTNIASNNIFKSIVLLNADKLTMDAQSALRRCIELFSHNTRFFIIVEDKYKLLKPILSRFCDFFIPEPTVNGKIINLHKYNTDLMLNANACAAKRNETLKKEMNAVLDSLSPIESLPDLGGATGEPVAFMLSKVSTKLYEKGFSAIDILGLLEKPSFFPHFDSEKKYSILFAFNKIKKEFRNEKLLIMFILNWLFISSDVSLENISFM
jgi:hypothetical protein